MRHVCKSRVACLQFVFDYGRLVVPHSRHEFTGTPRSFSAPQRDVPLTTEEWKKDRTVVIKKLMMLAVVSGMICAAWAATETIGDYTWMYRIKGDTAEIYAGSSSRAISPSPAGAVTIPSALGGKPVTSIGNSAFSGCSGLTKVMIPDSVTNIAYYAFRDCSGLTNVVIPDNVTSIGGSAFSGCGGLTNVVIGSGVTSIGDYAFSGCSRLTSVTIPDSVTRIGSSAFSGCSGLEEIALPFIGAQRGNEGVSDSLFGYIFGTASYAGCERTDQVYGSSSSSYYIPSNLQKVVVTDETVIGYGAFYGCGRLTDVTIPDSVTSIGERAFYNCRGLTGVTIPDSVTSIGFSAFYNCDGLTSVTIPDSVTNIGSYAFQDCSALTSVTIPDSVTSIASSAFSSCSRLTCVTIPDSVTSIGDRAFYNCGMLTEITIPDGVKNIPGYAFYSCTSLISITIPNGVTDIAAYAFGGCTKLADIVIPDSVKVPSGRWDAFSGCSRLKSVTIPQSVCSNRLYQVFPTCYAKIANVVISDGVANIGAYAFSNCLSLTSLKIPNSVSNFGTGAFYGCSALKELAIPQSVCASTMSTIFPDASKGITNVVVDAGVTELSQGCFSGCSGLEAVLLPESMTSICANAFDNCSSLESVRFLGDAPDTGSSIYYGTSRSLVTYVPRGSVGWQRGVSSDLPETWPLSDSTARAIAYWDGNKTAAPVVMPVDGTFFDGSCEVAISCATEGATIYFTTNGVTPRLVSRYVYSGPFVVDGSVVVKAIAVAEGLDPSESTAATLTKVDELTLPLAIGAVEMPVATGGGANWSPVEDTTAPVGGMAAQSGTIGEDGESWMETTVIGAGSLSFWWRVSCVEDIDGTATWDYLVCTADDKEVARIDGNTAWIKQEVVFRTAGRHTVRWTYVKDSFLDQGDFEDCAWVQGVEWVPEGESESGEALYSRDQIHALELGKLMIDVDAESQRARVNLYLKETKDLGNPDWKTVPLSINDLDIGENGTIGVRVPATGNAAFYKVVVEDN